MITKDSIAKVKATINIEDIIGQYVALKRAGSTIKGCCPFHNEKTPSFVVSPLKGMYKCFGCGVSGDAINFLMEYEALSYVEAIRKLAAKYNIALEETEGENVRDEHKEQEEFYILNGAAEELYKVMQSAYIGERGLSGDIIKKFGIGYAGNYSILCDTLKLNGYTEDQLINVGLAVRKGDTVHDLFRNRVIFPIHNLQGKIAGFGGRDVSGDPKLPKYINTPETPVYSKGKILYGFYHSKAAIRRQDEAILVEGYLDVIMLHQNGIENVVASSGTALSGDQVRLIKRHTRNILVLFDGDKAGIAAAMKSLEVLLDEEMNISVLVLPEGHDPDSYIRDKGKDDFEMYWATYTMSWVKFVTLLGNNPLVTSQYITELLGHMQGVSQFIAIKEASQLLGIPETVFMSKTKLVRYQADMVGPNLCQIEKVIRDIEKRMVNAHVNHPNETGMKGYPKEMTVQEIIQTTIDQIGGTLFCEDMQTQYDANAPIEDTIHTVGALLFITRGWMLQYLNLRLEWLLMHQVFEIDKGFNGSTLKVTSNINKILSKKELVINQLNEMK